LEEVIPTPPFAWGRPVGTPTCGEGTPGGPTTKRAFLGGRLRRTRNWTPKGSWIPEMGPRGANWDKGPKKKKNGGTLTGETPREAKQTSHALGFSFGEARETGADRPAIGKNGDFAVQPKFGRGGRGEPRGKAAGPGDVFSTNFQALSSAPERFETVLHVVQNFHGRVLPSVASCPD